MASVITHRRSIKLPFLLVVGVCLAQIAWWVVFQFRESERVETSERNRLHATCFVALVSLRDRLSTRAAPAADPQGVATDIRAQLAKHYPDLELRKDHPKEVMGAQVLEVAPGSAIADYWVIPSTQALRMAREQTSRTRRMFTAEGITFTVLVLVGVFLIYVTLRSEERILRRHELFLAGATHELKTPLASIKLGLQTLEQGRTDEEQASRYIHQMIGQIDRLEMEVTNLLNSAAGEARELQRTVGSLAEDVRGVVVEFEPRLAAHGVSLDLAVQDDSILVDRDPEAIRLVLRNLIDNALKYSPRGGTIHLELERVEDRARLRVADEGPGIPQEELELIFNRSYRGDSRPVESRGGAGLGLYLARGVITRHGGTLAALDVERGATVEIQLPISADSGASA